MFLLWWCPFKIWKEKRAGLQFTSTDYLSIVLTPIIIRWTVPLIAIKPQQDRWSRGLPMLWWGFIINQKHTSTKLNSLIYLKKGMKHIDFYGCSAHIWNGIVCPFSGKPDNPRTSDIPESANGIINLNILKVGLPAITLYKTCAAFHKQLKVTLLNKNRGTCSLQCKSSLSLVV